MGETRTFKKDMDFGMKGEGVIHQKISSYFSKLGKISNTKELYKTPYYKYDFEAEDGTTFELKTRRCSKNQYPTTIIPSNKIIKDANHRQFFIFSFTDGCYYILYNKELFDTFEIRDIEVFRTGINDLPKSHIHIPVNHLQKME